MKKATKTALTFCVLIALWALPACQEEVVPSMDLQLENSEILDYNELETNNVENDSSTVIR